MPVVSTAMKKRPSNRSSRAMRARSQIFASRSTGISLPLVLLAESPFSDINVLSSGLAIFGRECDRHLDGAAGHLDTGCDAPGKERRHSVRGDAHVRDGLHSN